MCINQMNKRWTEDAVSRLASAYTASHSSYDFFSLDVVGVEHSHASRITVDENDRPSCDLICDDRTGSHSHENNDNSIAVITDSDATAVAGTLLSGPIRLLDGSLVYR